MIERTCDNEVVEAALAIRPDIELDVNSWLADPDNIAFVQEEDGSVGLFGYEYPGVYTGHYFFSSKTRGRNAKALATALLHEMFVNRGAKVIRGLTPLTNQAARWMTRQLDFESHGIVLTEVGPCELFILTSDMYFHNITTSKGSK